MFFIVRCLRNVTPNPGVLTRMPFLCWESRFPTASTKKELSSEPLSSASQGLKARRIENRSRIEQIPSTGQTRSKSCSWWRVAHEWRRGVWKQKILGGNHAEVPLWNVALQRLSTGHACWWIVGGRRGVPLERFMSPIIFGIHPLLIETSRQNSENVRRKRHGAVIQIFFFPLEREKKTRWKK